jgi:predicted RNA-binding Zn-ribbon protein involved in translation (DUF1610 family)
MAVGGFIEMTFEQKALVIIGAILLIAIVTFFQKAADGESQSKNKCPYCGSLLINGQCGCKLATLASIQRREQEESKKDSLPQKDVSVEAMVSKPKENTGSGETPPKLIDCPDCGKAVSRRAASCPNCGCPINTGAPPKMNIPKCPTCGSTNVEKISLMSKAGKVALVGVFAISRVGKSFKCNNCGHQW